MQFTTTLGQVIDVITGVTRYPKSLLDPHADLENDLGIDSVKLVEILVALGQRFELDLVGARRDPAIRTIQQMVAWLAELSRKQSVVSGKPKGTAIPAGKNGAEQRRDDSMFPTPRETMDLPSLGNDVQPQNRLDEYARRVAYPLSPTPVRLDQPGGFEIPKPKLTNGYHGLSSSEDNSQVVGVKQRKETESLEAALALRKPLSGRVALVTGSGRGVGRAIARLLAKRGATVIVNSFHSRELGEQTTAEIVAEGGEAIHLWGSIANPAQVDDLFDEIERQFGYLDILVCNASDGRLGRFLEVTPDDMERAFRTNVIGHHQCARRSSPLMQRRGGGAIVTMSSIAARRYVEGLGAQGVVKAAVESLTRHLACELGGLGIRVNCVAGGPVYGHVLGNYPDARGTLNYWETLVPDGELCTPSDLAHTVAFLVSDEARGVNGAVWNVDHGLATRSHSRPLPRVQRESPEETPVI